MKKFKTFLFVVTAVFLVTTLTGCNSKETVNDSLEDIMEKLYKNIPDDNKPMGLTNIEVNDENIESFIGTTNVKYNEIIASESMVGSIAHSVILIRTKDDENVENVKKEIKEKINPRKWICVGVEQDEVIIKNKGNLILVVVVEDKENRQKISKAFDKL